MSVSIGWKKKELLCDFRANQIFLSSLQHPAGYWDSFSGYLGRSSGDKEVGCEAVLEIQNAWNDVSTHRKISKTWVQVDLLMAA